MGARRFVTLAWIFDLIPTKPQRSAHFSVSFYQLHRFGFAVFRSPTLASLSLSLSLSLSPAPPNNPTHRREKHQSSHSVSRLRTWSRFGWFEFCHIVCSSLDPSPTVVTSSLQKLYLHIFWHFRVLLHFFAIEVCVFSSLGWVDGCVGGWMLLLLLRSVLCDRVNQLLRWAGRKSLKKKERKTAAGSVFFLCSQKLSERWVIFCPEEMYSFLQEFLIFHLPICILFRIQLFFYGIDHLADIDGDTSCQ
jgi:hypothetical protein